MHQMTEKHFILATAGHVDHGKSALVKALTGIDPDRLPEEKARQITIDLGFAELNVVGPEEQSFQRRFAPEKGSIVSRTHSRLSSRCRSRNLTSASHGCSWIGRLRCVESERSSQAR